MTESEDAISRSGSRAFDDLRDSMAQKPGLRRETEGALELLVNRVNPSDRGQRFIVGAAAEWIVAGAAWSAGVLTVPGGHGVDGFDLKDIETGARGLWSVKASFAKSISSFRITNGLGGAGRGMTDPTVFLSPKLPGIVLVHPERHPDVATAVVARQDATELPFRVLANHASAHPECVVELAIPTNEGRGNEDASLMFTKSLISPDRFPLLSDVFVKAERAAHDVSTEVERLAHQRDTGLLTDEEFQAAKRRVLGL